MLSYPARIGKYSIVRRIGSGATSDVYLAIQDETFATFAIKQLGKVAQSELHKKMFLAEVEFGQRLHHKNIVHVFEADLHEPSGAYLVMEYANGSSLDRYEQSENLLPINTLLLVIEQIASALRYAAQLGIVHRDVKPANIILQNNGNAKLTDFGCAITQNGIDQVVAGSLAYMSPDQLEGRPLDERADIYSLGAVMYRLLTGRNTFEAESNFDAQIAILNFPIIPIEKYRRELPKELIQVINHALEKNVAKRHANWDEFIRELGIASHKIRMFEQNVDIYRGFSTTTQRSISNSLSTSGQFSRSGFSRSTMGD